MEAYQILIRSKDAMISDLKAQNSKLISENAILQKKLNALIDRSIKPIE